jgi:hypothetical protein
MEAIPEFLRLCGVITCLLYQQVSFGLRVALFLDFIKKALTKLFLTVTVDFLIIIFENEKHNGTTLYLV